MVYLERFELPGTDAQMDVVSDLHWRCYPFHVFEEDVPPLELGNITILYGGNGSGQPTLLNLMSEKISLPRHTPYNRTPFFERFVQMCRMRLAGEETGYPERIPLQSRFICSDDVFNHILRLREHNDARDLAADRAGRQWGQEQFRRMKLNTYEQNGVDDFLTHMEARRSTQSSFVRRRAQEARREYSNGESAYIYFTEAIGERGLYLLDEPENSLSPNLQLDLVEFLSASATCGAQLVISTHSPLLLNLKGARIYDLDHSPIRLRPWYELENVRLLFDFFHHHQDLFL